MQRLFRVLVTGLALSMCSYADDQVYQSVDKNGNIVIGNKPGGQLMQLPPLVVIPEEQMQKPQNSKELKRRQILQEELSKEQAALKNAQRLLAKNVNTPGLQVEALVHEKNIRILQKQLGY